MKSYLVVVTSRASYSRIRLALVELNKSDKVRIGVILAASAAEKEFGEVESQVLSDDLFLYSVIRSLSFVDSSKGMTETVARTIEEFGRLLDDMGEDALPDGIIVIADRFETIAVSIVASFYKIPLIHVQGGEVTGNIDEKIRHANTKLADLHLVSTVRAKDYLIRMGEKESNIFVTGCPSCDIASQVMTTRSLSEDMLRRYFGEEETERIRKQPYLVVMYHPVIYENELLREEMEILMRAVLDCGYLIIWFMTNPDIGYSVYRKMIREYAEKNENIIVCNSMNNTDFLELLLFSEGIAGNSSVGIRECSFMGVPAVNIGDRQFGRERAENVIDVACDYNEILDAIKRLPEKKGKRSNLYGDGMASERIAEILENCELTSSKTLQYPFEG